MRMFHITIVILITMLAGGCGHNYDRATNTGNNAHDETLLLFAYDANFEVFAKAAPLIVRQTGDILVHISMLENFKPLAEGSVTISLIVGADNIRQTLEEPTRPGIYQFSLQPMTAGTGRLIFDINTSKGVSHIVISNITVYTNENDSHKAAADAAISSTNSVIFTKEQSWKVDFATDNARCEPFGQIIRTMAQIQPAQGDERIIIAKTGGVALFSNENVMEGKAVGAGQALFSIDASSMADNNLAVRFAEAESEYNRAKTEYERKTELAKENTISQRDLLIAGTEFAGAEAIYNNLRQNFSAGRQIVSSPISGFVTRVLVQNGQYVEAGQPILIVSQNRNLFIKAELQPKYFDLLGSVTSANFHTLNNNRTYTLEELDGRMVSYGKSTDFNNPLIPVVFQVNNRAGLLPGSFIELFIKTQTNAQAVTVPNEAIVEEMGNYFVFLQLTPELFEKRVVKKGVTDGIRTEITEGVSASDRIVSKGAIFVKLAQTLGTLDPHAGHVH